MTVDELVEAISEAIYKSSHAIVDYGQPLLENPDECARAALTAIEASGWAVVPMEMTPEMNEAGYQANLVANYGARRSWSAMLAAAPKVTQA